MILDILARLSNAQDFTEADEVSTDKYDCGNPTVKNRIGSGERLSLVFVITTAAAGDSASATDTFDLKAVEDTAADLSTKTEIISRRVPAAELVAGALFEVPLPSQKPTKRYLGGQIVSGTGDTVSASCYLVPSQHVPSFVAYAKGYTN
jgi:hypothetical protein